MTQRPLLLVVSKYREGGGVETVANLLYDELSEGCDVDTKLVYKHPGVRPDAAADEIPVPVPPIPVVEDLVYNFLYFCWILPLLFRREQVLILANAEEGGGAALARLLFSDRCSYVHVSHGVWRRVVKSQRGGDSRRIRTVLLERLALPVLERLESVPLRWADEIVAVSDQLRGDLVDAYDVPEKRVRTIYNPIDIEFQPLDRDDARERLGLPSGRPVLLFVGDDVRRKGLDRFLETLSNVAGRNPMGVLVCRDEEAVRRARNRTDVELQIYDEFVSTANLNRLYAAADCLLYPTRYDSFGLVPVESVYSGTLPVISDDAGVAELFRDYGEESLVVSECGDAESRVQDVLTASPTYDERVASLRSSFERRSRQSLDEYERLVQTWI